MAFTRDSSLDISLGAGIWEGGVSDGTTLWFVDSTLMWPLPAIHPKTGMGTGLRSRDQGAGFSQGYRALAMGADPREAAGFPTAPPSGSWKTRAPGGEARAYVAATRARNSAKDISLKAREAGRRGFPTAPPSGSLITPCNCN